MGSVGIVTGRDNGNFLDQKDIDNFTNAQAFVQASPNKQGLITQDSNTNKAARPDYIAVYDTDNKRAFNMELHPEMTSAEYESLMKAWKGRQNVTERSAQKSYDTTLAKELSSGKSPAMAAALARKARNVSSAASFITLARQKFADKYGNDAITLRARGNTKSQIEDKIREQAAARGKKRSSKSKKK